jgi:CRP/FNR family cyclic AMP-dependent transcriptional regulator
LPARHRENTPPAIVVPAVPTIAVRSISSKVSGNEEEAGLPIVDVTPVPHARHAVGATDKLWFLSRHPFFGRLPIETRERLSAYVKTRHFKRGATVFSKGDPGTSLFVVRSGTIKVDARSPEGKDAVFALFKEGDFFGEIALLDGLPRTANAVAFTDCILMAINRRDFMPALRAEPLLMVGVIEVLCARLRRTTSQVEDLLFLDLKGRLAKALQQLARPRANLSRVSISQRELAEIAGLSREMINKQLRAWEANGWLELRRKDIVILRPDELAKLQGDNPAG